MEHMEETEKDTAEVYSDVEQVTLADSTSTVPQEAHPVTDTQPSAATDTDKERQETTDVLKEQIQSSGDGLVPNQYGRYTFFGLAGTFALLSVLLAISAVRHGSLLTAFPVVLCLSAGGVLLWSCQSKQVFMKHEVTAGGAVAAAMAVLLVMAVRQAGRVWLGVAVLLLMVVVALHLLVPIDSPAARLLLPWLTGTGTSAYSSTSNNTDNVKSTDQETTNDSNNNGDITNQRHTKQIRHRTVSVFHDWPAPIPFPARTLYTFAPSSPSELAFRKHDDLIIMDCRGNWWQARHPVSGQIGFVPSNFIRVKQRGRVTRSVQSAGKDELTVSEGQVVEVMEVHEAACLCRGVDGKIGSVPSECIQLINNNDQ